ncbi:MAG: Gldg family protein [Chthoniobacterales bacterium]
MAPLRFSSSRSWLVPRLLIQGISLLLLVIGINVISFHHYEHWDLSRSHRFSLSEQGSVLFSGINQPAHIIIYFSPTSLAPETELYGDLEALIQEYQIKGRENLIVEHLDPARDLTRAREIQAKYKFNPNENVVILDYLEHQKVIPVKELGEYDSSSITEGKKPRLVAFRGEQVINDALIELSGVPLKKIYFLQGHGEMVPGLPPLEIIGRYLQWQHITPALLNLSSSINVPEDTSLIVIAGARLDLSEKEAESLKNYWKQSGRLLILLDPTADTPLLDSLIQETGITPRHDRVVRSLPVGNTHLIIHDVTGLFVPGSEFTKQFLNLNILFLGTTQSLALETFSKNNKEIRVRPLIEALYEFWGSYDAADQSEKEISFQPGKDTSYPLVIAAMADRGALHDDRVALHAARMVVVGNCDFIKDACLGEVGLDFFSSSLNGLIDRISLAGNTAKMKSYFTLNLSQEEVTRIALWSILLIPVGTGLLGTLFLWRRRRLKAGAG